MDWVGGTSDVPVHLPLSRTMKQKRGFEHERTGFLLCPTELDWNDPECVLIFLVFRTPAHCPRIKRQLRSKELSITGSHWPIFVYRDEVYDPKSPWRGLFRNEILVKVMPIHRQLMAWT